MILNKLVCRLRCFSSPFSSAPMTLAMSWPCIMRISSPGSPVPAIKTIKATSLDRAATSGAINPPSLWPIRPILRGIDLGPRLEKCDPCENVAGEVFAGRLRNASRRASDAAIIDSQHGDAPSGQGVGQYQERLVLEDRLISVLGTRAADQDDGGKRASAVGRRQRARQSGSSRLIPIGQLASRCTGMAAWASAACELR